MANNSAKIAELEALLESGVKRTSTDGTSVELDLGVIREQLKQLKADDDESIAAGKVRPTIAKANLSNAW